MSTQDPAAPPDDSGSGARLAIRIVLIAVLVVAGVAFFIDQQARSQSDEAYKKLADLKDSKEIVGQPEIHSLMKREPDNPPENVPGHVDQMVETYSWAAGLPWRTYKVRVYYTKGDTGGGAGTETKTSLRYSTVTQNDDLSTPDPELPVAAPVEAPEGTPKLLPPGPPPARTPPDETPPAEAPEKPAEPAAPAPAEKG